MIHRRLSSVVLAPVLLSLVACGDPVPPVATPQSRPSDGLLTDPELQAVVEAQVERDGRALVGWLRHDRAEVRARAAFALASVQDPEAVSELGRALGDPDARVRRDAALALGQTGQPNAVRHLASVVGTEDEPAVRRAVLQALGRIPDTAAAGALLLPALEAEDEAVRTRAVARLAAVGGVAPAASVAHLLSHLESADPEVRDAAAYFFGRSRAPETWASSADRVRAVLDRAESGTGTELFLLTALGRLVDPADGARLREALGARDWRARTNAAQALGGRPWDDSTGDALLRALEDPSTHVAVSAAEALSASSVDEPEVLGRLKAWIDESPDRWQVAAPLLSLLTRSGEGAYVLAWAQAQPRDDEARWGVGLAALTDVPARPAREALLRARAASNPRIASAAVNALSRRWEWERRDSTVHDVYASVFQAALEDESRSWTGPAARVLADSALLAWGGVDTLLAARGRWGSPEHRRRRRAVEQALRNGGFEDRLPAEVEGREAVTDPDATASATSVVEEARMDWDYLRSLGPAPQLVFDTDRGRVVVRLAPEEAPQTVQTLARFTEAGRYDGVVFHRVVPNFVVQGGDFSGPDGSGGPGFTIRSEFGTIHHARGVIGMASAGKDTESSQFFISHSPQPHLDGSYTTFGWVVEGMDVVDRLQVGDRILEATVLRGGRAPV